MNALAIWLAASALGVLCYFPVAAQGLYDTYDGFTVPTTPVLPATERHPSLWFAHNEMASVKARKDAGGYAKQIWDQIVRAISTNKSRTVSTTTPDTRPILAKTLAFAWMMDQDATARQKAIDALMIAYDNVPRTATPSSFNNDFDEIHRATWLQNYCAAYDWMHTELTAPQDSVIRAKLIQEALLLRENMVDGVRYAPRPHNHRSKPAWAIATAALTFSAEARARDWLQFALTQLNTVTKYMFSADGVYREGPHYFVYSAVNFIPFLWHYKNVSGVDLFQYYRPAFEWPVKIRMGRGWLPNIEDSYVKPAPTHTVAKAYMTTSTELHGSEPLGKILQWNWLNTAFFTRDYTGATNEVTWDIDEYLTYDQSIAPVAPVIPPTLRTKSGQVIFRNNWNFYDIDSRYLIFHGVAEADNHAHPDLLSYMIESHNAILATDAGYGKDGFDDARRSWYVSPEAHNVVTVNGVAPVDWAPNLAPTDLHFLDTPFFDFAEKEARVNAPDGKLRRGIAFPNQQYWVVYDLGRSTASVPYRLNIHSRGIMSRTNNKVTWTTAANVYGFNANLHALVLASGAAAFTDQNGWTSLFKDEEPQSYVEARVDGDSVSFLHLLLPTGSSTTFPAITEISVGERLGFEMETGTSTAALFVLQQQQATHSAGSIATDALFAWADRDSSRLVRLAMNEGRHFLWNGIDIVSTDSPLTLAADFAPSPVHRVYVESVAQPTPMVLRKMFERDSVATIKLNGHEIPFSRLNDGSVAFTLHEAGVLEIIAGTTSVTTTPLANLPTSFKLEASYPNPFNASTRVRYHLPFSGRVTIHIFDALGNRVRELVDTVVPAGTFEQVWDGRNDFGSAVASGVYIVELSGGDIRKRTKILLLR